MTRRTLDYICMQPTREGQASHAHVHEIIAGLRRRGWSVELVEPPQPRPGRGDGARRAVGAAASQLRYALRRRFRPARFVYIRGHFLTLPVAVLAWMAGSRVVQEVNGPVDDAFDAWPLLRPVGRLIGWATRVQLRLADAVVVVTPGLAEYTREATGRADGFHVVGNGANTDRFTPSAAAPPAPGSPATRPYVVFIGALATWQGIGTIVAAAEHPAWPAGVDLVVAGDGHDRGLVEAAAARSPHIRWAGLVPYGEVPALVASAVAALVPMTDAARSRFGLSPLKLYEAMASGVPVVASDLPGLGDTVREHDCGITVPAEDAAAMAEAVARLVADPAVARAMGGRGRAAAVERYAWDVRAGETERVLLAVERARRDRGRGRNATS